MHGTKHKVLTTDLNICVLVPISQMMTPRLREVNSSAQERAAREPLSCNLNPGRQEVIIGLSSSIILEYACNTKNVQVYEFKPMSMS